MGLEITLLGLEWGLYGRGALGGVEMIVFTVGGLRSGVFGLLSKKPPSLATDRVAISSYPKLARLGYSGGRCLKSSGCSTVEGERGWESLCNSKWDKIELQVAYAD